MAHRLAPTAATAVQVVQVAVVCGKVNDARSLSNRARSERALVSVVHKRKVEQVFVMRRLACQPLAFNLNVGIRIAHVSI